MSSVPYVNTIETGDLSAHCQGLGFQDENETTRISTYLLELGITTVLQNNLHCRIAIENLLIAKFSLSSV
jgi:hypothetical protein